MLQYDCNKRQRDIIENLAPAELNKKRAEYRGELSSEIGKLERKKLVNPEMFTKCYEEKLEELKTQFRDVYTTVFPSSYAEELELLENTTIFLDKAGEESTRLFEYYIRTKGE